MLQYFLVVFEIYIILNPRLWLKRQKSLVLLLIKLISNGNLSLAFRILSALYKLSRFLECLVLGVGLVSQSYIDGHLCNHVDSGILKVMRSF